MPDVGCQSNIVPIYQQKNTSHQSDPAVIQRERERKKPGIASGSDEGNTLNYGALRMLFKKRHSLLPGVMKLFFCTTPTPHTSFLSVVSVMKPL